jgi:hypothetical protein
MKVSSRLAVLQPRNGVFCLGCAEHCRILRIVTSSFFRMQTTSHLNQFEHDPVDVTQTARTTHHGAKSTAVASAVVLRMRGCSPPCLFLGIGERYLFRDHRFTRVFGMSVFGLGFCRALPACRLCPFRWQRSNKWLALGGIKRLAADAWRAPRPGCCGM